MAQVYVSLGSNIERRRHIRHALEHLGKRYGPLTVSGVYESDAVGFDSDPFYNLVAGFDTTESPRQIQDVLHAIESDSGRLRSGELAARTLDLDLLLVLTAIAERTRSSSYTGGRSSGFPRSSRYVAGSAAM